MVRQNDWMVFFLHNRIHFFVLPISKTINFYLASNNWLRKYKIFDSKKWYLGQWTKQTNQPKWHQSNTYNVNTTQQSGLLWMWYAAINNTCASYIEITYEQIHTSRWFQLSKKFIEFIKRIILKDIPYEFNCLLPLIISIIWFLIQRWFRK